VIKPKDLEALLGKEVGLSRWFLMDQERIGLFADVTEDQQFIHIDPERAKATPFGGTIAHGFLTLSMLSAMAEEAVPLVEGLIHSVNYGFERIRFIAPVSAGKRIRGRFELIAINVGTEEITQTMKVTIEIEDNDKPALVAEWVTRHYFS
jgi:acyl dehydratase